ncbi:expressed unknown protein [Seminavis robusta]|uniref:Uncharacterized protein n=1 Tax=Seminavis robusta TaxID=568900 RepID=A0A9N8EID3_9STRA|nr:expressed unknown protein [Seminavis robusta]|eukprot:Sro1274_g258410.1 n/a (623) ;mRNA; r:18474-20342
MALRDEAAVQEQRRKKAGKKLASMEVPTTSSNGKKTKKKSRDSLPKGSFLESVSSMMDQPNTTAASTTTTKKKKKPSAKDPVRQMEEANQQPRKKSPAARRPLPPPPPPPPVESPPTRRKTPKQQPTEVKSKPTEPLAVNSKPKKTKTKKDKAPESTMSFLESVQAAMKAKEHQDEEEEDMVDDSHMDNHPEKKKQKKKKVPKLSLARQQSLQEELAKRRMENKKKRRQAKQLQLQQDDYVEDETVEPVGWFQLTVKENNNSNNNNNTSDEEDEQEALADKKKQKKPKQIKTTVEYSRHYDKFLTKKDVDEAPPGYYLEMLTVKKRHFHIQNLFAPRPLFGGRVYKFDGDRLQEILDKKDDKWFVKSRMASYLEQIDLEDEQDDDDEKGMEALSIFFGPNEIDKNNNSDDCDEIFSIASVESVHFSDDDEAEHEKWFQGRPRDTVEVMPGEFTILRKPEETHHAIETGTYMESLCLGCGKALLSVQDAVQVACPSCGSITPLNAICLHKPFGIATGVAAAKVTLAPRKSVFDGDAKQKAPSRKVVTGVSTRWIKEPAPLPMPDGIPATIITDAAAAPRKPAQARRQQAQRRPKETAQRPRGGNKQPRNKPATKSGAVPVAAR